MDQMATGAKMSHAEVAPITTAKARRRAAQLAPVLLAPQVEHTDAVQLASADPDLAWQHGLRRADAFDHTASEFLAAAYYALLENNRRSSAAAALSALVQVRHDQGLEAPQPVSYWLGEYVALLSRPLAFADHDEEAAALAAGRVLLQCHPEHALLGRLAERALELLQDGIVNAARMQLALFALAQACARGETYSCRSLIERFDARFVEFGDATAMRVVWLIWRARLHALLGEYERGEATVAAAFECAGDNLPLPRRFDLLGIACQLRQARGQSAAVELERLREYAGSRGVAETARLHFLTACERLRVGELAAARAEVAGLVELADSAGDGLALLDYRLQVAQVALLGGDADSARQQVAILRAQLLVEAWPLVEWQLAVLDLQLQGTAPVGLAAAFSLARRHGYRDLPAIWHSPTMARLAAAALEAGVDLRFVQQLALFRQLPSSGIETERWPWKLRVHSLGRFTVLVDGVPLRFGTKMNSKPQEMLKTIVAMGGRDLSVSVLTESLWPAAEADQGRGLFQITLYRLRKLLGDASLLRLADGRLSLDGARCWVDAWMLERICTRIDAAAMRRQYLGESPEVQAEQLLRLCRGEFLHGDDHLPCALARRDRLRSKLLRALSQLGDQLESSGRHATAALLYQRGLESEPLDEELYRRLMRCCAANGAPAAAMNVYRRCREVLAAVLGVPPSPATQQLYAQLSSRVPGTPATES